MFRISHVSPVVGLHLETSPPLNIEKPNIRPWISQSKPPKPSPKTKISFPTLRPLTRILEDILNTRLARNTSFSRPPHDRTKLLTLNIILHPTSWSDLLDEHEDILMAVNPCRAHHDVQIDRRNLKQFRRNALQFPLHSCEPRKGADTSSGYRSSKWARRNSFSGSRIVVENYRPQRSKWAAKCDSQRRQKKRVLLWVREF